jgi:nucleoside-diphosphate-sugar epimerase
MAKILVTGGAGQVGSRLVRQLLERNYEVRALVLPGDPCVERLKGLDCEIVEGNLLDEETAPKAMEGVEAVIHTANFVSEAYFDNNVKATFHVAKSAGDLADRLQRLVSVSSSGVYPNDAHAQRVAYHPVDESHPRRPGDPYSLSKLLGEEIVRCFVEKTGLRAAIVRPSGIVSGDAILSRWSVGFCAGLMRGCCGNPKGEMYLPGGGEPWLELEKAAQGPDQPCAITDREGRPWLYQLCDARDVAYGCVCALESEAAVGEAFNISTSVPIPYPAAAEIMAEVTGMEPLAWRAPVRFVYDLDNTKAKSWIGYRPKWGLQEMVSDAVAFRKGESDGMR